MRKCASYLVLLLSIPASSVALDYFPVTQCRLMDTRLLATPVVAPLQQVDIQVRGDLSVQQGGEVGCGSEIPPYAEGVKLSFIAIEPTGTLPRGFVKIWSYGESEPFPSRTNTNRGLVLNTWLDVPIAQAEPYDVSFKLFQHGSPIVIDLQGYYAEKPTVYFRGVLQTRTTTPSGAVEMSLSTNGGFPLTCESPFANAEECNALTLNACVKGTGHIDAETSRVRVHTVSTC